MNMFISIDFSLHLRDVNQA